MENFINFRTDMADERVDEYKKVHNLTQINGIKVESSTDKNVTSTVVDILNEDASKLLSKDIGKYITLEIKDLNYLDDLSKENVIKNVSNQIKSLINKEYNSVFVVGLGNVYVTPDAIGPKVIKQVEITRHLLKFAKELVDSNTKEVSAICPGVLGTTGIETLEIVQSIVEKTKPDFVIVIDSLVSQSISRLGNTIQLSNTGLTPGAGVKNKREKIDESVLGVPVIAIGIPTVVDMATITNETVNKLSQSKEFNGPMKNNIQMESNERYNMIAKILDTENYIVTPKDIDKIIDEVSQIISSAINMAV